MSREGDLSPRMVTCALGQYLVPKRTTCAREGMCCTARASCAWEGQLVPSQIKFCHARVAELVLLYNKNVTYTTNEDIKPFLLMLPMMLNFVKFL